jgi:hypothetical protein
MPWLCCGRFNVVRDCLADMGSFGSEFIGDNVTGFGHMGMVDFELNSKIV